MGEIIKVIDYDTAVELLGSAARSCSTLREEGSMS